MVIDGQWMVYHSHPINGHAFLKGSLQPQDLPPEWRQELEDFTDRSPSYGDGRLEWSPYPSGRPLGPWYVVAWTRRDEHAARRGSVVTQALLFPRDILSRYTDLTSALATVKADMPATGPISVTLRDDAPAAGNAGLALLTAFVRSPAQPVALIGESLWEPTVAGLWSTLWPEARAQLTFRAFDAPHQVVGTPDVLLVPAPGRAWTPPAWSGGVLRDLPAVLPALALDALISGTYVESVTATVQQARQVNALSAALRDAPNGAQEAVHALAQLNHAPLRATAKSEIAFTLIRQVSGQLAQLPGTVITKLGDLPDAWSRALTEPVRDWFRLAFLHQPEAVNEVVGRTQLQPWIAQAFQDALRSLTPGRREAQMVWSWWTHPNLLARSLPALDPKWDDELVKTLPDDGARHISLSQALQQDWLRLYGWLSAQSDHLDDLLQLPPARRQTALRGAREAIPAATFLPWAVRQVDEDVLSEATQALAGNPHLLAEADFTDGSWLLIWTRALPHLNVPDPENRHADVLRLVGNGAEVPEPLLLALAAGGRGQLLAHPQRDHLLSRLPAPYWEQTADAFLQSDIDPGPVSGKLLKLIRERTQRIPPSMAASRRLVTMGMTVEQADRRAGQTLTERDGDFVRSLSHDVLTRVIRHASASVQWYFRDRLEPFEILKLARRLPRAIDAPTWWQGFEAFVLTLDVPARSIWDELKWDTADFPRRGSERDAWQHAVKELSTGDSTRVQAVLSSLERRRRARSDDFIILRLTLPVTR